MADARSIDEWEWDPSHHPLPLTPAFGSVYPGWVERAMRVTFAEFGLLPSGLQVRLRNGYPFYRVRPPGLPWTPPGPVIPVLLRLWWLSPEASRRVRTAVRRLRTDHSTALLERWETRWRPAILADQQGFLALSGRAQSDADADLAEQIDRLITRTAAWVTVHFLLHGAIAIPLMRLDQFLRETPAAGPLRVADLIQGSSGASSAPARALRDAAAPLSGHPDLLQAATSLPRDEALELLRERVPAFAQALDRYLERYGHGIVGRYEFVTPTLAERPATLLPAILRAARSPEARENGGAAGADRLIAETAARLREPDLERRFRALVVAARRAYAVRDDNVQITFVNAFGLGRLALLEAGRRLRARGALPSRESVFFLTVPEVLGALRGDGPVPAAVAEQRRRRWEVAARQPPPRGIGRRIALPSFAGLPREAREMNTGFLRYMREIMAAPDVHPTSPSGPVEVRGIAAVRGRYTGTARVLRGQEDFDRLDEGEVLVCPITSPAWAAVLPLAGALVTDHGGVLSHPAVIAREFGIPAVVATHHATRLIPDGAIVEVDGDAGIVRVLG
jgi:pyruvate,water dikinase